MSHPSLEDAALRAFLSDPQLAVVATLRRDGTVALNPVWFEQRGAELWLNSYGSALWPKRLARECTTTVLVVDPRNVLRRAELVCDLVAVSSEGAREHIDRLARRFLGTGYSGPHEDRLIIRLAPRRVTVQITPPRAADSGHATTR
jgi:hypothetical protein